MVREQAEDGVRPSWSFHAFLTLATLLAAIAVVLDSSVLVIGAMVLGPEFAPVVAVALALVLRDRVLLADAVRQLLLGFLVAIAVTVVLTLLARAAGWITLDDLLADRPADRLHLDAGPLVVRRRPAGRHRRGAVADLGPFERPGGGVHLGDDRAGRGQPRSGPGVLGRLRDRGLARPSSG